MRKLVIAAIAVATVSVLALPAIASAHPGKAKAHGHAASLSEDYCEYVPLNVVLGGPRDDRLIGSFCDDAIYGFGGNDVIRGRTGTDVLRGGTGNDRISALGFEGRISGGPGFDTCSVIEGSAIAVLGCEVVIEV